jgi:FAD/FMN-containing dehydrogenase
VLNINARWTPEEDPEPHVAWARGVWESHRPYSSGGVYVNFLGNEGQDRVRAAYGEAKYARLAALKARYDPDNVLRLNQNITPAR